MFKKIIIVLVAALAVLGCEVQTNTKTVDKSHTIVLDGAPTGVSFKAEVYAASATDIQTAIPIGGGTGAAVTTTRASILVQPYSGSFNASYQIVIEAGSTRMYKSSVDLISGGITTLNWEAISLLDGSGASISSNHVFKSVNGAEYTETELPAALSVSVRNTGATETGALTVKLSGDDEAFTVPTTAIATIPVNETRSGAFTIRPKLELEVGVYEATVTVGNTANVIIASFSVRFTVNDPAIPSYGIILSEVGTYDFPPAFEGDDEPPPKTIIISNTGNRPTGDLKVSLGASSDFVIDPANGEIDSIDAGENATFKVTPKTDGLTAENSPYTATVTVGPDTGNNNLTDADKKSFNVSFTVNPVDPEGPIEYGIRLSIDDPDPDDDEGIFNFKTKVVGDAPATATETFYIYNSGTKPTGPLAVSLTQLPTGTTTAFAVTQQPNPNTINTDPGASASFKITPTAATMASAGTYTAKVTVGPASGNTHNIDEKSFVVSFTVTAQYPVLVLKDGLLNAEGVYKFKTAYENEEPTGYEVTIINNGNVKVEGLSPEIPGDGDGDFTIEPITSGYSIEPNGEYKFTITPTKTEADNMPYTATVKVTGTFGTSGTSITPVSFNVSYKVNEPFDSVADALEYLDEEEDAPVLLKMNLTNLADATNGWTALLTGLGATTPTAQTKLVELDLSLCGLTSPATTFDLNVTGTTATATAIANGKAKIVSLILPAVTVTNAGTPPDPSPYSNLARVSGKGATVIGANAFFNFEALTEADFPNVTAAIETSAFSGCTALTDVKFPLVTAIGTSAFYGCTALTGVPLTDDETVPTLSFPAATSIGANAFQGCTALETVVAINVTSIVAEAFSGCTKLTTASFPTVMSIGNSVFASSGTGNLAITMGTTAPTTLGTNIFSGVAAKTVNIKVPLGATGNYDGDWKEAFMGKGSTGAGTLNGNITVTVGN